MLSTAAQIVEHDMKKFTFVLGIATTLATLTGVSGFTEGALAAPPAHRHDNGRRMSTPPPRGNDPDEVQAAQLMANSISGLGCDRAGEALNRLSNQLLGNIRFATNPNPYPPAPRDRRGQLQEEMRRKWKRHLNSPTFWRKVWDRLAESYRLCDLNCFDDGNAIGLISGAGYCAASVGLGGLDSPGFVYQAPLPLCQNAIAVGCQNGYQQATREFQGCSTYTSGIYEPVFDEYVSQDCHIDDGF